MTSVSLKLQYLFVISVYLHTAFSNHCYQKLPHHEIKVVTYGEPCHSLSWLPISVEEPIQPVEKSIHPPFYQPLKLNYRTVSEPIQHDRPHVEYPIAIEVPEVPPTPLEIVTPDPFRGMSYGYNIQAPPPSPVPPIPTHYDFDLQLPIPTPTSVPDKPVKLLKGLTSRIDRVLIPACESPSCNCKIYS